MFDEVFKWHGSSPIFRSGWHDPIHLPRLKLFFMVPYNVFSAPWFVLNISLKQTFTKLLPIFSPIFFSNIYLPLMFCNLILNCCEPVLGCHLSHLSCTPSLSTLCCLASISDWTLANLMLCNNMYATNYDLFWMWWAYILVKILRSTILQPPSQS